MWLVVPLSSLTRSVPLPCRLKIASESMSNVTLPVVWTWTDELASAVSSVDACGAAMAAAGASKAVAENSIFSRFISFPLLNNQSLHHFTRHNSQYNNEAVRPRRARSRAGVRFAQPAELAGRAAHTAALARRRPGPRLRC